MKVHIVYTPTDASGTAYNLTQFYTVADLQKLVDDLAAGLAANGQPATAALRFDLAPDGTLSVTTDSTL